MPYTVRAALRGEEASILNLIQDGIKHWAGANYESIRPWYDTAYTLETISKRIESQIVYVATYGEAILGTVTLTEPETTEAYLGSLYCFVKGKGVGTNLLGFALDKAKELKYETVLCEIYHENLPSINLMTKHGAKLVDSVSWDGNTYDSYQFML